MHKCTCQFVHIGTKLFAAGQRVKKIEKNLLELASKKLALWLLQDKIAILLL